MYSEYSLLVVNSMERKHLFLGSNSVLLNRYWNSNAKASISSKTCICYDNKQVTRPISQLCWNWFNYTCFHSWSTICCIVQGKEHSKIKNTSSKWRLLGQSYNSKCCVPKNISATSLSVQLLLYKYISNFIIQFQLTFPIFPAQNKFYLADIIQAASYILQINHPS